MKSEDSENQANWKITVDEISPGVYEVEAVDTSGRKILRTGTDPESLIAQVKQDMQQIESERSTKGN